VKIAVVVQRYGEEVVGGAETLSRLLAERFAARHDVTVVTTCAKEYRTWANELPDGLHVSNGVQVVRWPVRRKRRWTSFGWKSKRLFGSKHTVLDEYRWMHAQGPECPELIEYLQTHASDFNLFLFFTYLYYPTFFGLPMVAEKSVLVPTAHDEPAIHLDIFRTLFHLPRFIAFNTDEEKQFVHSTFHNEYIPHETTGVGVEIQPASNVDEGYLLYIGRIENGKSCPEIFEYARESGVHLKVIGKAQIPIPRHVEYLGFVSEGEKQSILSRCRAVVLPSRNESLSLAALEAWAAGKPVIVSEHSPVLRAHVDKSGGGYTYRDAGEFRSIVRSIDANRGLEGRKYVAESYSWESVLTKYDHAFSVAANGGRAGVS
jgi:glycosyltransferase involved in cell wall biosynthesis